MADGAAPDIGLADRHHGDSRLDPRRQAGPFESGLHRERVHDSRQHAHIVGRGAVDAFGRSGQPAEDVAPTDDQAHLGANVTRFLDIGRNALDGFDVDAEVLGAHQRLAGHL